MAAVVTVAEVDQRVSRSGRRRWSIAAVVLSALLLLDVSASFVWPKEIPRFAFLPRPSARSWNDGCNGHQAWYERSGVYWEYNEAHTLRACPGG